MFGIGTLPDLLRLVVVPVLAWTAWRDIRTRRVPNVVWYPLAALGLALLAWELFGHLPVETVFDRLYLIRVGVSVFFVVPLSYLFWRLGGFGGADAKALMVFAILLPTFPSYTVGELVFPLADPTRLGVFSMTVLTNTVIVGLAYPLLLAVRNLAAGEFEFPLSFVGRRVPVSSLSTAHGRLFESPDGITRNGLDLDALRMYLRWRGLSLSDVRANPEALRNPESIGETFDPTDGAVHRATTDGGTEADLGTSADTVEDADTDFDDPWGAAEFLDEIEGSAYGTTPEKLRGGLELVTAREAVWISPGIPFIVPMFVGLVVALIYGDILFGVLRALGIV
ncbi:A24 family peptidase [Haloferax mediterranei ATCC 33500]|uniref:A24 family peptidase n=1 Tax=Haloferax mediterranei (strain ATCC 33500 / DSM 1411 / JCM 8866 / NBRC 14739 / NCIMB 2177 / R-4) TaxID=523841 RepID=I3R8U1_HALMT|nr:A24 family peptidase [Haloferax mediterranei]AFK20651.1 prepilin signal peptidase [Haloferax mediterranei ATCC 33500]AHZ22864.1 peptidase A24 [Haloferax mediterranei ATCC 33500]EMA03029.1 prepilin signal peptidase [Haloferax mediterranei ATCC 33500]MDX5987790.1 A24 family peptidase C-terminal domain-containing protein [Haloferax mediterranei ATCC 33500]QCQ74268.1 A24 family peptidase [Haloferax mediterranei ATCC 33500]